MGDWHYSPSSNRWPLQVTFFNSKVEYSIYPILPVITSLYSQNGNLGELGGWGCWSVAPGRHCFLFYWLLQLSCLKPWPYLLLRPLIQLSFFHISSPYWWQSKTRIIGNMESSLNAQQYWEIWLNYDTLAPWSAMKLLKLL